MTAATGIGHFFVQHQFAEYAGAQANDRADGEIDAAGDDEQPRAQAEDAFQADALAELAMVARPSSPASWRSG